MCAYGYLMMVFVLGGPALFVLSWAIIKAFAVENENLDGVSITLS